MPEEGCTHPKRVIFRLPGTGLPKNVAFPRMRVALADDSLLIREGIRMILDGEPGIELVAVCEDRDALLGAVDDQRPDVVVTDIRMPPSHRDEGIEIAHAYHLVPGGASKGKAVGFHLQARGYDARDCIAVGDSIEDLESAEFVGRFARLSSTDRALSA